MMRDAGLSEALGVCQDGTSAGPSSYVGQMGHLEVSSTELFEFKAQVDNVDNVQGRPIPDPSYTIFPNPYQHSQLMRSMRHLRLKRAAARVEEDRLGIPSNEGPRVSRLVIHLRLKT